MTNSTQTGAAPVQEKSANRAARKAGEPSQHQPVQMPKGTWKGTQINPEEGIRQTGENKSKGTPTSHPQPSQHREGRLVKAAAQGQQKATLNTKRSYHKTTQGSSSQASGHKGEASHLASNSHAHITFLASAALTPSKSTQGSQGKGSKQQRSLVEGRAMTLGTFFPKDSIVSAAETSSSAAPTLQKGQYAHEKKKKSAPTGPANSVGLSPKKMSPVQKRRRSERSGRGNEGRGEVREKRREQQKASCRRRSRFAPSKPIEYPNGIFGFDVDPESHIDFYERSIVTPPPSSNRPDKMASPVKSSSSQKPRGGSSPKSVEVSRPKPQGLAASRWNPDNVAESSPEKPRDISSAMPATPSRQVLRSAPSPSPRSKGDMEALTQKLHDLPASKATDDSHSSEDRSSSLSPSKGKSNDPSKDGHMSRRQKKAVQVARAIVREEAKRAKNATQDGEPGTSQAAGETTPPDFEQKKRKYRPNPRIRRNHPRQKPEDSIEHVPILSFSNSALPTPPFSEPSTSTATASTTPVLPTPATSPPPTPLNTSTSPSPRAPGQRPETTDFVARNIIGRALGKRIPPRTDERSLEIARQLKEQRERKKQLGAEGA